MNDGFLRWSERPPEDGRLVNFPIGISISAPEQGVKVLVGASPIAELSKNTAKLGQDWLTLGT